MQEEEIDPWLKLRAVAVRIGQSPESARLLVVSGVLAGTRHSPRGAWQVRESECNRYVAELESSRQPVTV